ncbi:MAG: polysaccharide biosynthesis tyrosine autokinase [Armatimonadetes bacterium]|nr:polysaccharide biosynthesis tyrosine autokinase [Armatimonadota bacterium]
MEFWTIYRAIRRKKWLILLCMALTLGAAMCGYRMLPTFYQATVVMMPSQAVLRDAAAGSDPGQPVDVSRMDAQMSTLLGMAQSRAVCARAVRELGIGMSPAALQRNVKVEQLLDTQAHTPTTLIRLQVQGNSPGMSVVMANAVAESFRDFYKDVSHREAVDNRRFLEDQVRVARAQMDEAEGRLREYTVKKNITMLPSQVQASLDGLKGLRTDLDASQARLMEVSARLAVQSRQLSSMGQTRKLTEMTSDGSAAAQLRTQISSMEKELSMLHSRYTLQHPKVVNLETQLARARQELARTSDNMVARETITRNPAYDVALDETRKLQAERASLVSRVGVLGATVRERERQLAGYAGADVDLGRRTLEYKNAQDNYNTVLARLNQAKIGESLTTDTGAIQIIDPADKAQGPIHEGPDQTQLLIGALILGLALGVGFALLSETLDNSIHTTEDAARLVNLPVMGAIPSLGSGSGRKGGAQLMVRQPDSSQAEAFRFLATDLLLSFEGTDTKCILVASARPNQGGTATLTNLAITLAQAGKRVILADADLRAPRLHKIFGVDNMIGLSDVIMDRSPLSSALKNTGQENLLLMTAGSAFSNPWQLLRSQRFSQVVEELKDQSDFVLFDSPSALLFADAVAMSRVVDGVIVVIKANQSSRADELRLRNLLNKARANTLGVVVNGVSGQVVDDGGFEDDYYTPAQMNALPDLGERRRNNDIQGAGRLG